MRILVLTHNYPRFDGDPAGAFVARIARGAAAEHDVLVVCPHTPGVAERERLGRLEVRRVRYAPDRWERVAYRGDLHEQRSALLVVMGIPALLLAMRAAFLRAVREFRPDVVHAHWSLPNGWLATAANVPLVVTCHGTDVRMIASLGLARSLAARTFARAAAITTVSDYLRREIDAALPGVGARAVVAPMPVDVERFTAGKLVAKASPPRILYAGNLLESKGVADLVDAIAILRKRGVACALKVLGQGPALESLRARASAAGVADAVEWSPFVSQAEMPAEYGAASITVLPTRGNAEGLGLTLVEALLSGSAVVGTRAGGIPEVVEDGVTGLLSPASDPSALADRLERLLADDALRTRLTERGSERAAATYSSETATATFLALYDRVRRH